MSSVSPRRLSLCLRCVFPDRARPGSDHEGSRPFGLFSGTRRGRNQRPLPAGAHLEAAENPGPQKRRSQRRHERPAGSGGDQHGQHEDRGQRRAVRDRPHRAGHQVGERPQGSGREHPGKISPEQRQEHSPFLRRAAVCRLMLICHFWAVSFSILIWWRRVRGSSGLCYAALGICCVARYIAMTSLQKIVGTDHNAVQRHRGTIVDCLKDQDASVKRRALELSLALVSASNVRSMMKELLLFLSSCPAELRAHATSGIFNAAERYAPSQRWHIDTMLHVLITAGGDVRDETVPNLIQLITIASELHCYTVHKLYRALIADISQLCDRVTLVCVCVCVQQSLVQVACWCIGEYGDLLLRGDCQEAEPVQVTEDDALDALETVLHSHMSSPATRGFALTATMKLSTRITDNVDRIRSIVSIYGSCIDVELQQRAVEYNALFKKYDHMRAAVLERMPVIEKNSPGHTNGESTGEATQDAPRAKLKQGELLLPPQQPANQVCNLLDLLGDSEETLQPSPAFGGAAPGPSVNTTSTAGGDLLDLLGGLALTPLAPAPVAPPVPVYDKSGVTLTVSCEKQSATGLTVTLTASNATDADISSFTLQAAVPKSVQLHMKAPSGDALPARGSAKVTQLVVLNNPNKVNLKMRVRVSYTRLGSAFQDTVQIDSFPGLDAAGQ
ncbi:AP-1 complex subunit gamma-like 2 isoform X3 [Pseudoliparis swirei]|uniref:AP-1 complex subunit gamma-like 2 isoform X3 n=1 Tax=Pseudoliparis swirei TaxID=2059687 RepID=UPI0024BE3780|nr:AP-1 complex subunit gamma-like 2 isoform X3 [Pseudoliparis swirei]